MYKTLPSHACHEQLRHCLHLTCNAEPPTCNPSQEWVCVLRFVLEHINAAGANTVIAELAMSCWTGKGTLTIRQTEHELPRDVIIATGIAMEAIRHQGGN